MKASNQVWTSNLLVLVRPGNDVAIVSIEGELISGEEEPQKEKNAQAARIKERLAGNKLCKGDSFSPDARRAGEMICRMCFRQSSVQVEALCKGSWLATGAKKDKEAEKMRGKKQAGEWIRDRVHEDSKKMPS